ncbi:putative Cytoplasmic tRNA 2-thiolation protein 1 [Paratrimastix pyriformis]|uniref:Cytoplasmic tRNA 2-thiolation protein 1 n=1 Tax=Paratrimastix pyriformis TaxID=342808 RepID=A0ABQ8UA51_9EUKA|nr:putative Cytoplasmic tRNA 2-thiolation protein 1 [Paratrimastix pyriformis]
MRCARCGSRQIAIKRPRTDRILCKDCFCTEFEEDVHLGIVENHVFTPGDLVAVGVSGGKDSTVLLHVLHTLNARHQYGIQLHLLSADEGISGYRDNSLETVYANARTYELPLTVVAYKELFGWTMNEIHQAIGKKNNCTYCGVLRRKALDVGAQRINATKLAMGHNADDYAETVLMNVCRGDIGRMERCTDMTTGGPESGTVTRVKPLKYVYQKEVVMYAHFKKLLYFSTPCTYAEEAYRGYARTFLNRLHAVLPSAVADIIHAGERLQLADQIKREQPKQRKCQRCGYITSQALCQACALLEGLNTTRSTDVAAAPPAAVPEEVVRPPPPQTSETPDPQSPGDIESTPALRS